MKLQTIVTRVLQLAKEIDHLELMLEKRRVELTRLVCAQADAAPKRSYTKRHTGEGKTKLEILREVVEDLGQPVTVKEVAGKVGESPGVVGPKLHRLVKQGLIKRAAPGVFVAKGVSA